MSERSALRGVSPLRPPPAVVAALPRRLVSRMVGRAAALRLPSFLRAPLLGLYARRYGANLDEMARPLAAYASFQDFFTRALAPGLRPQDPDPEAITSPCDGRVLDAGRVEDGSLLQVKGVPYALADLLGSADEAAALDGGAWATLYLAPGDYHRFHWPFAARVERVRHLPGDLWPVNPRAVASVRRLFARNERVAVTGTLDGGGRFAFVPVGALNVGSIRLEVCDVRTNRDPAASATWAPDARVRRGEACGRFRMGSSIVVVLGPGAGTFGVTAGAPVRAGERIGRRAVRTGA